MARLVAHSAVCAAPRCACNERLRQASPKHDGTVGGRGIDPMVRLSIERALLDGRFGETQAAIAERHAVGGATVSLIAVALGAEDRNVRRLGAAKIERAAELLRAGLTPTEVAGTVGASRTAMSRLRKRLALEA